MILSSFSLVKNGSCGHFLCRGLVPSPAVLCCPFLLPHNISFAPGCQLAFCTSCAACSKQKRGLPLRACLSCDIQYGRSAADPLREDCCRQKRFFCWWIAAGKKIFSRVQLRSLHDFGGRVPVPGQEKRQGAVRRIYILGFSQP